MAAGRLLFWYAPVLGQLQLRANPNPLGEVAEVVSWLRRWTPRSPRRQLRADRAVAAALVVAAIWLGIDAYADHFHRSAWLIIQILLAIAICASLALLIFGWITQPLRAVAVLVGAAAVVALWAVLIEPVSLISRAYLWLPPAYAALVVALHALWSRRLQPAERQPLLLVIDDLDRCTSERVVRLLESVHTLLKTPEASSTRSSRARLMVLLLADGRWIRKAFESSFSTYDGLGSDVHDLGSDFLQKVVDHTVIVPELSQQQIQDYVRSLLDPLWDRRPAAPSELQSSPPRSPDSAESDSVQELTELVEQLPAAMLRGEQLNAKIEAPELPVRDRTDLEVARARREATAEAAVEWERHLVAYHRDLLPHNPRMIKRVANATTMLFALKSHLGHHEPNGVVMRAAIMFIRFPTLVDALLSDPSVPAWEDLPDDSPWRRSDVEALTRGIELSALARCFGRDDSWQKSDERDRYYGEGRDT